jgi:DNA-directed RNA polymerase subunit RPC12/RpoP
MAKSFKVLDECPECGGEILIDITPVDEHPEIGAGCELEIQGTRCHRCGSLIGGYASLNLCLESWDEEDG